jgi:hypothetical protein
MIWGGDHWLKFVHLTQEINVDLQQTTLITLNVITTILCVWKVLTFRELLLKGWNGQTWKAYMCVENHICKFNCPINHN